MMISAPSTVQRPVIPVPGTALTTVARFQADFGALGAILGAGVVPNTLHATFGDAANHAFASSLFTDTLGGMKLLMTAPPARCGYPEPSLEQLVSAVKLLPGVTFVSNPEQSSDRRPLFDVRTNSQESADRLQQLLRSEIGGYATSVVFDLPIA